MGFQRHLRIIAEPLLLAGFLVASAAQAGTQPGPVISHPPDGSVILRPEPIDVTMQSLHVLRQLPLANIRSQPIVTVGATRLNFKPMLENPRALFTIATNLRKLPQFAVVVQDSMIASEIDQGIVVQSKMTYRLKPGACDIGSRRAMIAKAGVSCATQLDDTALAAAFANPKDAHFIADPGQRATALAAAKSNRAASSAQIATDLAELRGSFEDPAKRAQLDASVGAAESARLAGLSDEQLTMELVNSAETTVEQTIFIPGAETPNARLSTSKFAARNEAATDPLTLQVVNPAALSGLGGGKPKSSSPPIQDTTRNLDTHIFLTGFTLGREYEWSEGVSTTIYWCGLGCKKTYSATVYARIGLGFGLRFPMQISGLYKHHLENGKESASLAANFEPIDGTADDYAAAGLSKARLFHGQEIVAEAVAEAWVNFKLPIYGSVNVPIQKFGDDYTAALPAPYANGQFKPPAPKELGIKALEHKFEDADLLLGAGTYGAFGAKVFPQVKFELNSTSLRFKFHDLLTNETTWIDYLDQGIPQTLTVDPDDHSSHFTLSDPEYKLAFTVTPGLVGELFIHLGVWSHNWDYGVWFPQVAVTLPPGGQKFVCHEGTSCSRRYDFSPTSQSDSVGPASPEDELIQQWKFAFEKKWKPQCPDDECKNKIFGATFSIANFTGASQKLLLNSIPFMEYQAHAFSLGYPDGDPEKKAALANHYIKIQQGWQAAENQAAEALELAKIRMSKQGHSTPTVIFTAMPRFPPPAVSPPLTQVRPQIPTLAFPPTAPTRQAPEPTPAPAPPPIIQGRTPIPNLTFPTIAAPRAAPAVQKSTICRFTSGPRAGQVQDYAPMAPIPVGSNCQDARGSYGTVIAP